MPWSHYHEMPCELVRAQPCVRVDTLVRGYSNGPHSGTDRTEQHILQKRKDEGGER